MLVLIPSVTVDDCPFPTELTIAQIKHEFWSSEDLRDELI